MDVSIAVLAISQREQQVVKVKWDEHFGWQDSI